MNKGLLVGFMAVFAAVVLGVGLFLAGTYNRLIAMRQGVDASWGQVENVLQRRFDLIPNLVETVKGYAKHEKDTLTEVTALRSQWGAAKTPPEKIQAAQGLEAALGRLMVVIEKYPELKANQNFLALQDELAGTENRIAVERKRYNDSVQTYNTTVQSFPTNLVAGMFSFERSRDYFQAEKSAQEAPKVKF